MTSRFTGLASCACVAFLSTSSSDISDRTLRYILETPRWILGRARGFALCGVALLLLGWPMRGDSQTQVATVGAGTNPFTVAVNPVTNKIYVANQGSANVTVIDGATNTTTTVAAGTTPGAVAVNPVTNKIYVSNNGSNDVTVIDGATNTTTTVAAGTNPFSVAVNPITNQIYVSNSGSANVTVIDGATNATTTVAAGTTPAAVAVSPVTNKIYVSNTGSNNVTVIDGATNTTTTVAVGTHPLGVGVNPVTNQIYVANALSSNVTIIDGATSTTTTVTAGINPEAVAVNPVTNKIYVANGGSANVTVIDGATNATTTVAAGSGASVVAVNPVTNKIYVPNQSSNNVTVIDGATNATTTVAAGTNPRFVALNPVTDKIYVTNEFSSNVTVIDGATNTTTTVAAGTEPFAVAVNQATNKIYVANANSNNVSVIDGATNATTTVAVCVPGPCFPLSVAVNPVTNKIYVADETSVTVIDGATNATTTVATGSDPVSVAVNPVTNQIYVANANSNNVTVIDGATNTTTTVAAGSVPEVVAVNPVTNKIYVANYAGDSVTVIDGATNTTTTVATGTGPDAIAVNPVTNKIYVGNVFTANITVIDGATNSTTTVAEPSGSFLPGVMVVNPVTNKIYAINQDTANVTVIDGATNTTTNVAAGTTPEGAAVNPVTNQIYVANNGSNNVTALTEQQVQTIPLTTAISPLPNNQTANPTPSFTFTASSTFSPTAPPVDAVYFQVDTWQGPSTPATATMTPGSFTAMLPPLSLGIHILYAYATDGQDASSIEGNGGFSNPLIGNIAAYLFLVTTSQAPTITSANNTTFTVGTLGSFTVTTTGSPTPSISDSGAALPNGVGFTDNGNGTGTLSGTPSAGGTFPISFTASNGVGSPAVQPFTLTVATVSTVTSVAVYDAATDSPWTGTEVTGASAYATSTVTGSGGPAPTGTVTYTFYGNGACTGGGLGFTVTLNNGVVPNSSTFGPLSAGVYSFVASYSGDSNYRNSTSSCAPFTVQQATTSIAVTSVSPASEAYGQDAQVTITAVLSWNGSGPAPTGTVTISGNAPSNTYGVTTCAAPSRNTITCSNTYTPTAADVVGTYTFSASFSGDSNYNGSSSTQTNNFSITQATSTTSVMSSQNPSLVGRPVTFTATIDGQYGLIKVGNGALPGNGLTKTGLTRRGLTQRGLPHKGPAHPLTPVGPTGTVTWSTNTGCGTTSVSGDPGTSTCITSTLPQGTDTITATYSGDSNHSGSSGTLSGGQVVNQATVNVTVGTSSAGLAFSVDSMPYSSAQNFTWTIGDMHTIATTTPQYPSTGVQDTFANWSDAGALSHSVTASASTTSYTASFNTTYQLTTAANPTNGGTVMPSSGTYYAPNTVVSLTATANANYAFSNWTGNVANPNSASTTVTMTGPQSVTANFVAAQVVVSPTSLNFGSVIVGRTGKKVVTLKNIGRTKVTIGPTTLMVTIGDVSQFQLDHVCTGVLRPGSSCLTGITFRPDAVGSDAAVLNIVTSVPGSPIVVPIMAAGIAKH